jgi:hypothetical protein
MSFSPNFLSSLFGFWKATPSASLVKPPRHLRCGAANQASCNWIFSAVFLLRVVKIGSLIAGLEIGIAEPFHMAGAPLGVIVIITNL